MDGGRILVQKLQARVERDITREYRKAHKEVQAKLDEYLSRFEAADKEQLELLRSGQITKKDYQDWRVRHIGIGKRWEELRDTLANDLHNTKQIAMSITKGYMPEAYALGHNYGAFAVERQGSMGASFSLIDHDFVERLVRDNPKLLPDPSPSSPVAQAIARNKDLRWNRNKLQSAMVQGCLQGEGIGTIANRFQRVAEMSRAQALRHARTAVNGAANGGRHDAYKRAEDMGIELVEEWSAVLDHVTRDSHIDMDGERKPVSEELWSNGLRFPADPYGPPEEVYNCRCDVIAWVKGFEPSRKLFEGEKSVREYGKWERDKKMEAAKGGLKGSAKRSGADYVKPKKNDRKLTSEEIIKKVGGEDKTSGSCTSQAFAYIGNKGGYDVTDYRGGSSCEAFKSFRGIEKLMGLDGVVGYKANDYNDYNGVERLLNRARDAKDGKEFLLAAGKHAAIVRKEGGAWQYLELQDKKCGFVPLTNDELRYRFRCHKQHTEGGVPKKDRSLLIDADSLAKNKDFIDLLGYLNTNG